MTADLGIGHGHGRSCSPTTSPTRTSTRTWAHRDLAEAAPISPASTRDAGRRSRRGAAVHPPLRRATVVVKFGGNAMTDRRAEPSVRRGHRAHARGRHEAGRRARRRPADRRAHGAARARSPSSATACGSPTPRRSTSPAWCSSARSTATSCGAINVHGPLGGRAVRRGRRADRGHRRAIRDLGFVGDVARVNPAILERLLAEDLIPVVSTIGADVAGQAYNINADTAPAPSPRRSARRSSSTSPTSQGCWPTSPTRRASISPHRAPTSCRRSSPTASLTGGMIPKIDGVPRGRAHTASPSAHLARRPHPPRRAARAFTDAGSAR